MTMTHKMTRFLIIALSLFALAVPSAQQPAQAPAGAPDYGPSKGTLVIVGGGGTDGTGIVDRFAEDIEDAPERADANRHRDRCTGVDRLEPAPDSVGA